ncbi:MAG: phosphate signaling complex protein PhoU [Gemmatimonadales bacterium]|nr:phosphate signaling complex protein PhoU [Gemmatimonadales bacterium]MYG18085.1 phosphate signaling complex protein PhoU [Gemmatimonadales bacterium]MYH09330.1 phosphate signaling complex protein PhoU [Gemmatimonadales bacterium]MYL06680.1 phosphate signaling complex protein PhoU [Gemmatimonadales bacterium]
MSFRQFDDRVSDVTRTLHQMAHDIEELVQRAVALVGQPTVDAEAIREADDAIDRAEVEVEESTVEILALHHPVASDLRVLVTVLKINNDLERIGDHAVNIAEAAERLAKAEKKVPVPPELDEMSRMARAMLRDALDAFVHRNANAARSVIARDDRLDQLQDSLSRVMITHMPEYNLSGCLQVILIGRNLERIGDLATNIGEDVVYMVQGITIRHQEGSPDPA